MSDELGDRMKIYEGAETSKRFLRGMPIIARLDGRSFHNFTKGLPRPYCQELHDCMAQATIKLVEATGATIGYTQSDEITLAWIQDEKYLDGIWFNGNIHKMTSVLASIATVHFYRKLVHLIPHYADRCPTFDCRVWQVANETEASNAILWRELDAIKNSIQMAASSVFSHTELHEKHTGEMLDMLRYAGIEWNSYPEWFKRGSYFKRIIHERKFTDEELEHLPEKHQARKNPDLVYSRSVVQEYKLQQRLTDIQNREDVLFRECHEVEEYA